MSVEIKKTTDIAACHALRLAVFVKEQNVPLEDEMDDLDGTSTHILVLKNNVPVGTARIYEMGETGKIGRVCVLSEERGSGLGKELVEACLDELQKRPHLTSAKLGAQEYAIPFYEKLGFEVIGEVYMDGGIRHFDMVRGLRT